MAWCKGVPYLAVRKNVDEQLCRIIVLGFKNFDDAT